MSETCQWLHETLKDLPLKHYPDIDHLPDNGIYFFYEGGEASGHSKEPIPRIVRIGINKKDGRFPKRIADHYLLSDSKMDFDSDTPAPHDFSILRKNIGRVLLSKINQKYLSIWNTKFSKKESVQRYRNQRNVTLEKEIEQEITSIIRAKFSFRYLKVDNMDIRELLEAKLIGTVAPCSFCKPSANWLGSRSPIDKIRVSGMWQTSHLGHHPIDEICKKIILKFKQDTLDWISAN